MSNILVMIKRILFLVFTAFLVGACVEPLQQPVNPVEGNGEPCLNLTLRCGESATKVDNPYPDFPTGDTLYNENKIIRVDWFVFTNTAPVESDVPVLHGRVEWTNDEHSDATREFLAKSIDMGSYYSAFKNSSGEAVGSVFVIANLPSNYLHQEDLSVTSNSGGIYENGSSTRINTLGGLLDLRVRAEFNKYTQSNAADPTTATFDPQDAFVMRSNYMPFELTTQKLGAVVHADLKRIAAKISMEIDVAAAIDEVAVTLQGRDTTWLEYVKTWYPDLNNIQVYMSYANRDSDVKGTPDAYSHSNFFSYNRYSFQKVLQSPPSADLSKTFHYFPYEEGGVTNPPDELLYHKVSGTPFYTYPMTWATSDPYAPFIKIIIPWKGLVENIVTKKYNYGNPLLDPVPDTLVSVERVKWNNPGATQEFYYKIAIPTTELTLRSNQWMWIKLDVAILGSRNDDDMITTLAGRYYVLDWDTPVETSGELSQGNYLSVARDTFFVYGGELDIPVSSSHTVSATFTKVQYKTFNPANSVTTNISGISWNNAIDASNSATVRRTATLTPSGRTMVKFEHPLKTDIDGASTSNRPDVSPYTFNVTISNGVSPSKNIVIVQMPPLVIESDLNTSGDNTNGNVHINRYTDNDNTHYYYHYLEGYFGSSNFYYYSDYYVTGTIEGVTYVSSHAETYTTTRPRRTYYLYHSLWLGGVNGRNTSGDNSNQNMYVIATTVAPAGAVIADPRSTTVNNLTGTDPGSWSSPKGVVVGTTNSTRQLTYYYPSDNTSELTKTKISPQFRVASSYGMQRGSISYEFAQRRCASYQEDGIPAGRWRVPTKAEIEYMIKLSSVSVIPSLFQPADPTTGSGSNRRINYDEGGYWTADGGVIYPWNAVNPITNNVVDYLSATELANTQYALKTNWVRCVYDEWFWGTTKSADRSNKATFYWGDEQINWTNQ